MDAIFIAVGVLVLYLFSRFAAAEQAINDLLENKDECPIVDYITKKYLTNEL